MGGRQNQLAIDKSACFVYNIDTQIHERGRICQEYDQTQNS
jgi:hypothetical protein